MSCDLTIHPWLMSDGGHHLFGRGQEMVHCVGGVSEHL